MTRIRLQLFAAQCAFIMCFSVVAGILGVCGLAHAQTEKTLATEAQNPAPINAFEIEGGYKINFKSGGRSEGYYRISYKGSLVKSEGTPFKDASGLDLAVPALTSGSGDRNKWSLRFEKGTTTIGGGLFEASGVQPIALRGLEALDLRGTAIVAGDTNGKNIQLAAGLESPPFRIPGFKNTQVSNWVVFGVNAQRRQGSDSGNDSKNFGLFTYRAFLGKSFGWRKSADVAKTASKIAEDFTRQAPTYEDAKKVAEKIRKIAANQRTSLQQLFVDAVTEAGSEENWKKTVIDIAHGNTDAVTDQPALAIYAEDSGWYSFAGSSDGGRLKNLLTVTLDYWFLPSTIVKGDNAFLRLRYENGYERAVPTDRKNQLLLSINLKF
ncbi:MAG TPA: hypothetical protein VN328_02785 [Thermodesulfovibrionales bacterium]|nr:hypothetical protein [Thermodesulfovibrionales bacterium]